MIPDSHAHLDLIERDPAAVVQEAREAGVSPIITIGITIESSRAAVRLAESIDGVYAAVGVHPNDTASAAEDACAELEALALSSERVVAIGETGLDYYRDRSPAASQQQAFRSHVRLARKLERPLIVHDRQAHDDTLELLAAEDTDGITIVMHCFSGDAAVLDEFVRRGYYLSFAGPVTFKNAADTRETARLVPLDRLLAETDSPFLSPEPFRGKPNVPARVRLVAEALAGVHGMSVEEMAEVLARNTARAFSLPATMEAP